MVETQLIIHNVNVITQNGVQREATILVQDGHIRSIRTGDTAAKLLQGFTGEIFDGKGMLAAPGLINTHTHIAMGLFRNYADDLELMDWLQNAIWPIEAKLTGEYVYWGTQLGIAEMLRSGTTCFSDMYFFMEETAKAVAETGMRAVLSRGLAGVSPTAQEALKENTDLFKKWHGFEENRIKVMLGPHAPYTCPEAYLRQVADLAKELGAQVHMHLCETKNEVETCIKEKGRTPIAYVNDLGIFDTGCVAAHCVHITPEDMDIMAAKNVRVAHNPQSNLKLASGIAPVPELLSKNIVVGLGTDGSASNNNADMLEEVRLAATLHKARLYDPLAIPAQEALNMGTVYGAKVLDYDDLGVLAPGYKADIVLYNTEGIHWLPRYNDIASLVYAANSSDVDTVFIAGKCVMKHRELLTIDEEKLRSEIHKAETYFKA